MQRTATLPDGVILRVVDDVVEFVGPRNVERIFGISEDRARILAMANEIEMVTVRRAGLIHDANNPPASGWPGSSTRRNAIRLYRADSIRDFINRNSRRRPQEPLEAGEVAKEAL